MHCEYYIWEADRVGAFVRDALVEARGRGVEVRILVDGVGSRSADRKFWEPLTAIGISGRDIGQHLERHLPLQPGIPRPIDLSHPAGAEQRYDFVRSESNARTQGHVLDSARDRCGEVSALCERLALRSARNPSRQMHSHVICGSQRLRRPVNHADAGHRSD